MPFIISPQNFSDFLLKLQEAIKILGNDLIYRGQINDEWQINSTLQRTLKLSELLSIEIPRSYVLQYFKNMQPSQELLLTLDGKGCPIFEMSRHHQQNYDKAKIIGISGISSPMIDFSLDPLVALFFANFDIDYQANITQPILKQSRQTNAAIYVIDRRVLQVYPTIKNMIYDLEQSDLSNLSNEDSIEPCIILPSHILNDSNDPKPKLQKAHYVIQVDLRYSIEGALLAMEKIAKRPLFFKILLSKEWFNECSEYLSAHNCTLNYFFPIAESCEKSHQTS